MSQIVLSPNASGTGQFTIASPNSNTNQTLNLPDATGTVLIDGTSSQTLQGNLNVPSLNTGQLAGQRNKIINGKMDIAQRGTSFPTVVTGTYTLDRFQWQQAGTGVVTISQQADVPSSNEFQSSLRVAVTTADTSIAAGDIYAVRHAVEGYNVRDLIGKTFTLSFWVRSSKTGTHCVSLSNSGANRSFVAEYTVNSANTWEFKSITISGGLITAGTWDWTNGIGISLWFMLAAGTTWQTTAGAWQTGAFYATSNQVNCLDTVTNGSTTGIFAITGVQLEVGGVATPFEHRPYGAELALCQRYYEKSYAQGTNPGTATGTGNLFGPTTDSASSQYTAASQVYRAEKRAAPTVRYWDVAGNIDRTSTYTAGGLARTDNNNNVNSITATTSGFSAIVLTAAASFFALQWEMSAEL